MGQIAYPKIFAVILNYNGRETIKMCLDSIFQSDYPNLEVVVIDNNSTDGSLELAKNLFSKFYFIKNETNLGFAAGNNLGIKFALEKMADYVFLLNNDAKIEKNTLSELIKEAEKRENIGIASPLIINGNTNKVWFSGGKVKWLSMKAVHNFEIKSKEPYESEYVSGCAMIVKKEVFREVGMLDEEFFLYYEDADFCLRAKRKGFNSLVVPEAIAYHFEKSELDKSGKIYWLVISGILFFQKNTPFFLKPWMYFYLMLRKIKNRKDLKEGKNEMAKVVRKAYDDLKNF
jgi:GT2 family glycosyltransferase